MAGKGIKKLLQSVIFLPYFISWVIVGSIELRHPRYWKPIRNGSLKYTI